MLRDQKISFRRYIDDGGAGKKEGRGTREKARQVFVEEQSVMIGKRSERNREMV